MRGKKRFFVCGKPLEVVAWWNERTWNNGTCTVFSFSLFHCHGMGGLSNMSDVTWRCPTLDERRFPRRKQKNIFFEKQAKERGTIFHEIKVSERNDLFLLLNFVLIASPLKKEKEEFNKLLLFQTEYFLWKIMLLKKKNGKLHSPKHCWILYRPKKWPSLSWCFKREEKRELGVSNSFSLSSPAQSPN